MNSWIEGAIKQPITVTVGVILIVLSGVVAFNRVPVQMTPQVDSLVIAITTTWENASPQEIETEVIDEQEEVLQGISGITSMTSTSQSGQGQIRLEFETGTDIDAAMAEVDQKINQVPSYPEGVDQPRIVDIDPESTDYIAWVGLSSSDPHYDTTTLFDFMDKRLKPIFERIEGVSEVGVVGSREREVQIQVDPTAMAQRGLTTTQLVNAIRQSNVNFSGGDLPDGKNNVRLRMVGRYDDTKAVENIIIRRNQNGEVRIGDVARVVETYKELRSFVKARGHIMPFFNYQLETGANLLDTMQRIKDVIAQMNTPGGILESYAQLEGMDGTLELVQVYDSTEYVYQALGLVQSNIFVGGFLAIITLLMFLRSLTTIGIIALAIPVSVIGSIVILLTTGRTINIISLAGMAFAVGMVVDNAIVVIENIFRHLEMGKSKRQAAFDGAKEVSGAVLASTMTTLVVFFPILLIQQEAGQLFRDIVVAISSAVGLSFFVSILLIPSAAALFLNANGKKKKESENKKNIFSFLANFPKAIAHFTAFLTDGWKRRIITIIIFIILTVVGIRFLAPPMDYLPKGNRNIVFGILIPPPGYNVEQLIDMGGRLEERVKPAYELTEPNFAIEKRMGYQKRDPNDRIKINIAPQPDSPKVDMPALKNYFFVVRDGRIFHGTIVEEKDRVVDAISLFNYATAGEVAPDTFAFAFQLPLFRLGGSTGSAIKIDLTGDDLSQVSGAASALMFSLMEDFGPYAIQPEPSNFMLPIEEMQVKPNDARLQELGLTRQDIAQVMAMNGDGLFVGDYDIGGQLKDLKLISKDALNKDAVESLRTTYIATPHGNVVDLASVAQIHLVKQPNQIKRVNRQRAVTLQLTPPNNMPLEQAINTVNTKIDQLRQAGQIPPTVDINQAGSAGKLNELMAALLGRGSWQSIVASSMFLALLVVYLTMVVLFQSWLYPLVIMVSVPLATLGGFLGLSIVNNVSQADRYLPVQNLDVLTMLGFMILIGVVVNNAILIVHQTLNFLEEDQNITPAQAIYKGVESRVRPILMSTLTSVGGMLPLVLMPGSGSELYRGLGSVVVGGLLVSTVFTLVLVPVVLSMVFDFTKKKIT